MNPQAGGNRRPGRAPIGGRRRRAPGPSAIVAAALLIIEALAVSANGLTALAETSDPQISEGVPIRPVAMKADLRTLPSLPRAPDRVFPAPRQADMTQESGRPNGAKQVIPGPTASEPSSYVAAPMSAPITNFAGLDRANWGDGIPPDPVGDVGPIYFIQAVNTSFGVFRKSDGILVAASTLNALWLGAGTGTACDSTHQGDPTVVYDPMADRWIVADFAFANLSAPPYYECIAVSRSGDPVSGGWYLYPLRTDDLAHPWFADYPKMGIWPDGLYMTANMFLGTTGAFQEVRVWALNRADMEAGAAARSRVVDLGSTTYFSLLPSNTRSATGVPPAGRENILIAESETLFAFDVFKFHVDYSGAGSTFTGPTEVSQTPYSVAAATVPTPGNSLDSLRERLMMQAQYANLNGVESVWTQHTVRCCGASSPAGIQWTQINVTGGSIGVTPIQQQLYPGANDGLHRWMGSLAVDQNGDMALGYSTANSATMPDIRYAGRLSTDPLGTLPQTETTLLPGISRATQSGVCGTGICTRWGDYSAMTLDPDGCTFWYTNEYYATTGLNWQTRIGAFRFASCTPIGSVPTVAGVVPSSGPAGGGTVVAITGTGFATSSGATTVAFGANAATAVSCATTTSCNATSPAGTGTVNVRVSVGGRTSTTSAADQFTYTAVAPCTTVSFTANPASPQAQGTVVAVNATASCGTSTAQYKWWVQPPGGAWAMVQDWGGNTFSWNTTGLAAGAYRLAVWARAVGSTADLDSASAQDYSLVALLSPCTAVPISPSPASPQLSGTTILWTATASCGTSTAQYKWWVQPPRGAWAMVQDWGGNTFSWNTTGLAAGAYNVGIWARAVGSTADSETSNQQSYSLLP